MKALHLTKRFAGSLWPFGPRREADEWARSQLLDSEVELWNRMCAQDQRHSIGVARRVEHVLGERASRPVLAAALLGSI